MTAIAAAATVARALISPLPGMTDSWILLPASDAVKQERSITAPEVFGQACRPAMKHTVRETNPPRPATVARAAGIPAGRTGRRAGSQAGRLYEREQTAPSSWLRATHPDATRVGTLPAGPLRSLRR